MLKALRGVWSKESYGRPHSGKEQDASASIVFDIDVLSNSGPLPVILCTLTWCCTSMAYVMTCKGSLKLALVIPPILQVKNASQRAIALKDDYADAVGTCILAGVRAPELATGMLQKHLEFAKKTRKDLIHSFAQSTDASVETWTEVLQEYDVYCDFLLAGLEMKLAFWTKLPYSLAGLAHCHGNVAREYARRCIHMYESSLFVGAEQIDGLPACTTL